MATAHLELILNIPANLLIPSSFFVLPHKTLNLNARVKRLNGTHRKEYYLHNFGALNNSFDSLKTFVKQKQFNYNYVRFHCSCIINYRLNLKRGGCL